MRGWLVCFALTLVCFALTLVCFALTLVCHASYTRFTRLLRIHLLHASYTPLTRLLHASYTPLTRLLHASYTPLMRGRLVGLVSPFCHPSLTLLSHFSHTSVTHTSLTLGHYEASACLPCLTLASGTALTRLLHVSDEGSASCLPCLTLVSEASHTSV